MMSADTTAIVERLIRTWGDVPGLDSDLDELLALVKMVSRIRQRALGELDRYHKELAFIQIQHRNTLRVWPQFRQLDIANDALMRIRTLAEQATESDEISKIINLVRSAQVKIQGEK